MWTSSHIIRATSSRSFGTAKLARPRRAWLYVPASSEKMMDKARRLEADTICLDLEDGVAMSAKEQARKNLSNILRTSTNGSFGRSEVAVRINPINTHLGRSDVESLIQNGAPPDAILIPKIECPEDVWYAHSKMMEFETPPEIALLIESPRALLALDDICSASSLITALVFGGDDYAASVGAHRTPGNMELFFARNMMLLHAAKHGLAAIDIVNIRYKTPDGLQQLRNEAEESKNCGFSGKQIIHPLQIPIAHKMFAPTEAAVNRAQSIINHAQMHENSGVGAFELDGEMIDAPTVKQAEKLVARALACGVL